MAHIDTTFINTAINIRDGVNDISNIITDEIQPTIEISNKKIKIIENILNEEICPMSEELNEVYIPIITRILLSNIFMFLNRIFKWYTFRIHSTSPNSLGINFYIVISPSTGKAAFFAYYDAFKCALKKMKKDYGINYKKLVDDTISYNKISNRTSWRINNDD